jgi:hypothetical protein
MQTDVAKHNKDWNGHNEDDAGIQHTKGASCEERRDNRYGIDVICEC